MNIQIQTLDDIDQVIRQYIATETKKGSHPTIHGVYGYVRSLKKYSFFGDYPLLQAVLVQLKKSGMPLKRSIVRSVVNRHCDDLKGVFQGKKAILDTLFSYL